MTKSTNSARSCATRGPPRATVLGTFLGCPRASPGVVDRSVLPTGWTSRRAPGPGRGMGCAAPRVAHVCGDSPRRAVPVGSAGRRPEAPVERTVAGWPVATMPSELRLAEPGSDEGPHDVGRSCADGAARGRLRHALHSPGPRVAPLGSALASLGGPGQRPAPLLPRREWRVAYVGGLRVLDQKSCYG